MVSSGFSLEALNNIENSELLRKTVLQVKKDINMVGLDFQFEETQDAKKFVLLLNQFLLKLIETDFDSFLNLLYRVDISEREIIKLQEFNSETLAQKVTLLVLRKEWQKVWFRNKNL